MSRLFKVKRSWGGAAFRLLGPADKANYPNKYEVKLWGVFSLSGGIRRSGGGRSDSSGLSYVEIIVALAILTIVVGVGAPSLGRSKQNAENRALQAEAKTLNDAIYRVEAGGSAEEWMALSNILHIEKDKDEAVRWLVDQGYVTQHD